MVPLENKNKAEILPPHLTQAKFEEWIEDVRPRLHRYVAHMIGSAVDAEDIVQEALLKAYNSLPLLTADTNIGGWLFRIAHNKAIDYLRRFRHESAEPLDEHRLVAEPDQPLEEKDLAAVALSLFVKLTSRQRSCVILKDVLGYSLLEISELLDASVPEIKATLHRGRTRLRQLAASAEVRAPTLDEHERQLLERYIDRFNARDFDAVQGMLASEVQVELVGRRKHVGISEIETHYLYNYNRTTDWRFSLGAVDGYLAILVHDPQLASPEPTYFILVTWEHHEVLLIRDYRHVRYVVQDAEISKM